MLVSVYYNIRKGLYSILAEEGADKGLVIGHARAIEIRNPKFVVRESGRKAVLRQNRKNVHAFVRGELRAMTPEEGHAVPRTSTRPYRRDGERCRYNPHDCETFMVGHEGASRPCHKAAGCLLELDKVHGRPVMTVVGAPA